jgi:hypothetical protein
MHETRRQNALESLSEAAEGRVPQNTAGEQVACVVFACCVLAHYESLKYQEVQNV